MDASYLQMENEWIRRAAAGEADAFGRLVAEHQRAVYAFLLGLVRRPEVADDLTQEAFIKAWKALPGFEGRSAFRTWVIQIALNLARSWARRPRWLAFFSEREEEGPSFDELPEAGDAGGPAAAAERKDESRRLSRALEALSPREREAVVLKYVEDMKISEVAAATGMAEGTVKAHLFHAVRKMKAAWEKDDERSRV